MFYPFFIFHFNIRIYYLPSASGTSSCYRGAVATCRIPESNSGPEPPRHVAERTLRRGGVSR